MSGVTSDLPFFDIHAGLIYISSLMEDDAGNYPAIIPIDRLVAVPSNRQPSADFVTDTAS